VATTADIVRGAYLRLGLIRANGEPTAAEAAVGLLALNDMMFAWANEGVDISHTELALATTFPLDAKFHGGVKAMLAVRLAEENGDDIKPKLAEDAAQGWLALQAAYISAPDASFDSGMNWRHRGDGSDYDGVNE
jgi:hypothetical protein